MLLPRIERVTKNLTFVHFLLMFGYKLFSLYFPLFLVLRGFSLPQVGWIYFLIYFPLAFFSPIAGFLNHKINSTYLIALASLGYAFYALGMILFLNPFFFYLCQILLGISAALFFVSARTILISSNLKNYDQSFGWFYSAPFYADALAPVVGAFLIWKFNFLGVFLVSLFLQIFCALFSFFQLRNFRTDFENQKINLQILKENYQKSFIVLKKKAVFPLVLISFLVLFLAGFFRAFFVLFLKDELFWSQNLILFFVSLSSFLFLPISLFVIKNLAKWETEKSIYQGALITGFFSVLFGVFAPVLSFLSTLLINLGKWTGSLICNSGRSGLVSKKLKREPEEAGAIDTIFAPLGGALGAFVSGILIKFLGYQILFILGGIFIIGITLFLKVIFKRV